MKKQAFAAGILASILLAGSGQGAESRARVAANSDRPQQTRNQRTVSFKTERSDSWLCQNVSVFFCTDLFPSLNTTPTVNGSAASLVPDRSRTPGH